MKGSILLFINTKKKHRFLNENDGGWWLVMTDNERLKRGLRLWGFNNYKAYADFCKSNNVKNVYTIVDTYVRKLLKI